MRKYIILLAVPVLGLLSCKDFLEPYSPSEFTPKTAEQLNEVLLGTAYPTPATNNDLTLLLDVVSDDVSCINYYSSASSTGYSDRIAQSIGFMFSWQPQYSKLMSDVNSPGGYDHYSSHYNNIVGTNAVIDYIDKVSGSAEEKNYVKGQALALRGYLYLQLVNIYGAPYNLGRDGIGVPLKIVSGLEERKLSRNTVGEIYDQIIKDLLAAETALEQVSENMQFSTNYRINLPAVRLLLARAYLYMEEWENAVIYSEKVMADKRFSLLNLNGVPLDELKWTGSSFSRTYYNFFSYDNPECIWLFGRAEDISYYPVYRPGSSNSAPTLLAASPDLVNSFIPEALQSNTVAYQNTPDLRLYHYLVQERNTSASVISTRFRAYGKYAINPGNNSNLPKVTNVDFGQALRLSEAYVIGAEAYAMLYSEGDGSALDESLKLMNELRKNRYRTGDQYITLSTSDASELIEFARNERRCEMCVEGLRWFDLRRWGMPEIIRTLTLGQTNIATYRLEKGDPSYIFPIPHKILEENTALTQAPLYNGGNMREPIQ